MPIRPIRTGYKHVACNNVTIMSADIARTFACYPTFYTTTYCVACGQYFPVGDFVWEDTNEKVGS